MKTKGLTHNIMKKMGLVHQRDWVPFTLETMKRIDPMYYLLATDKSLGIISMTFVHEKVRPYITYLGTEQVSQGWHGYVGSKRSLITSLRFYDNVIRLCATHFRSGTDPIKRIEQVQKLYDSYCNSEKSDIFVLFGDLNTRVHTSPYEYQRIIKDGRISNPLVNVMELMAFDEVKSGLHYILSREFIEPPIQFPPTYRFDKNEPTWTYSSKRVASW